ncbi:hypothetical protein CEXT_125521 [Caerostris extrusa]|uniref:Uncharacterized protein n=1 Tax=Caerostris extrusa TaxID=172846 RepID=A0AAV4NUY5_CAEEX|nr:hypothetical protein CEXT_125521 [Caerostris extrusa]
MKNNRFLSKAGYYRIVQGLQSVENIFLQANFLLRNTLGFLRACQPEVVGSYLRVICLHLMGEGIHCPTDLPLIHSLCCIVLLVRWA